jgi:hypothetical protein
MAVTCSIPVTYAEIASNYPRRTSKTSEFGGQLAQPELRKFMSSIPGTPCCVQVSHAMNMVGHTVSRKYGGMRRNASPIKIDGRTYYYLLAVDEMEAWLTDTYGEGEILRGPGRKNTSPGDIKRAIKNRPGLLTMWGKKDRWHTEFWNGARYLQDNMSDGVLENPRIMFWDLTLAPPAWLTDYMDAQ